MMSSNNQEDSDLLRVRALLVLMIVGLLFLAVAFWNVQVKNASEYESSLSRQSIRAVRMPGIRGVIRDRNGIRLADNRPSYCVVLLLQELRVPGKYGKTVSRVESVIDRLSKILGLNPAVKRKDIEMHLGRRRPLPFIVWRDVSQDVLARWFESSESVPGTEVFLEGVDIYVEPVREYSYGDSMAHLMGYVGRIGKRKDKKDNAVDFEMPDVFGDLGEEEANAIDYYIPEMIGKSGIERALNEQLSGIPGGKLIRVDASGFRHKVEKHRDSVSGKNLSLAIDVRIQKILFECLGDEKGAGVVIDPRNGDILAAASAPSYNSNDFSPRIRTDDWNRLRSDKNKPLLNRAISEMYPAGSIFKPIVALAALENGKATGSRSYHCSGVYMLGNVPFKCWKKSGHGSIGMRKAIEQSCNSYFCQLGLKSGHEVIYHMASAVGLGSRMGIEIGGEVRGLVPNDAWKRKHRGDKWRSGDTCNFSIGQGALCVTPLQMASMAATLANGGKVYRPRLVLPEGDIDKTGVVPGELIKNMGWSAASLRIVRGGMHDVIETDTGTGKRARISQFKMAGKTGTAEYGSRSNKKQHTWMIAFAPYESPRYAVAIVIEDGLSGGRTVAPKIKQLMEGVFELESGEADAEGEET